MFERKIEQVIEDYLKNDELSINLGSIYKTIVACELRVYSNDSYYYDH